MDLVVPQVPFLCHRHAPQALNLGPKQNFETLHVPLPRRWLDNLLFRVLQCGSYKHRGVNLRGASAEVESKGRRLADCAGALKVPIGNLGRALQF